MRLLAEIIIISVAAVFLSPCYGQEALLALKSTQQMESSRQKQEQIPLEEKIRLGRSLDQRAWWSEYRAWVSTLGWPIAAIMVVFFLRPILSRSEQFVVKVAGAELNVKSSTRGSAFVASELLTEIFSRVRDLTNEQVKVLYMVLRVQRYKQAYEIPSPSGDRDNEFHCNLRALRQANLVHSVEGGRFKEGRHAQVTPWGIKLADHAQDGLVDLKTPQGEEWKAIGAEITKREIKNIVSEMDKKAVPASPA